MTDKQKELATTLLNLAKKNLEKDGDLAPVGFVLGEEFVIVKLDYSDYACKHKSNFALGLMAKKFLSNGVFILNDSYFRQIQNVDKMDALDVELEKPSYYPDSLKQSAIAMAFIDLVEKKTYVTLCKYVVKDSAYIFEEAMPWAEGEGGVSSAVLNGYLN